MSAPIVGNVRREGNDFVYWSDQTGRQACVTFRDAPGSERPLSFEINFFNGTKIAGEMSSYTAMRWAARWVMEGRIVGH